MWDSNYKVDCLTLLKIKDTNAVGVWWRKSLLKRNKEKQKSKERCGRLPRYKDWAEKESEAQPGGHKLVLELFVRLWLKTGVMFSADSLEDVIFWGPGGGSVTKSTGTLSCQGSWCGSQHHRVPHNHLKLRFQEIWYPLLTSSATRHSLDTHTYMHAKHSKICSKS